MSTQMTKPDQTWADLVGEYESTAEPLSKQFARIALKQVGNVGAGRHVLDIAAGTGALSVPAAEAGASVLATDISPGMVARLSERLAAYPSCSARVMDGQALDVADGSYDASFSLFGIPFFTDWKRGLEELSRATRVGGYGCVVTWTDRGAPQIGLLLDAFKRIVPALDPPKMPQGMTTLSVPDNLANEMTSVRFRDVEVQVVETSWTGRSIEHLVSETKRAAKFVPAFAQLNHEHAGELSEVLQIAITNSVTDSQFGVSISARGIIAIGRRA